MKRRIFTQLPKTGKREFIERCLKAVKNKKGKIARDFIIDFNLKSSFKGVTAIRVTEDEILGAHSGWHSRVKFYRTTWNLQEVTNKEFITFLSQLPDKKK